MHVGARPRAAHPITRPRPTEQQHRGAGKAASRCGASRRNRASASAPEQLPTSLPTTKRRQRLRVASAVAAGIGEAALQHHPGLCLTGALESAPAADDAY